MIKTLQMREYLAARRRRLAAEEWDAARGRGAAQESALSWGAVLFFAAWLLHALGVL